MEDNSRAGKKRRGVSGTRFVADSGSSNGGTTTTTVNTTTTPTRLPTKMPLAFCPRRACSTTATAIISSPQTSKDKQQQSVVAVESSVISNSGFNNSDNSAAAAAATTLFSTQGVEEDYSQFASIDQSPIVVVSTLSKRTRLQSIQIDYDDDYDQSRTDENNDKDKRHHGNYDVENSDNDTEERRGNGLSVRRTSSTQQLDNDNDRGNGLSVRRTSSTQQQLHNNDNNDTNHNDDDKYDSNTYTSMIQYYLVRSMHKCCKPRTHPPCYHSCCYNGQDGGRVSSSSSNNNNNSTTIQKLCRIGIILFMIVTITFVCLDLLILHDYLHVWLDTLLAWLTIHPFSGGVAFIGVFIIGSLCFFPVALLSLGAGYTYDSIYGLGLGIFYAFIVCYIGCLLGSIICFARSRFLMRRLIERFATKYPIVRAVDRAFETNGFRIFLLLRLSPALPFNALNYIGGIMAIRFRQFWWATCIGIAPTTLWTVVVGGTFGTVAARGVDGNQVINENRTLKTVVLAVGIVFGVLGFIGTGIFARKELTKIIMDEQNERTAREVMADTEIMSQHSFVNLVNMNGDNQETNSGRHDSFVDLEGSESSRISLAPSLNVPREYCLPRTLIEPTWTPDIVALELPILPKFINKHFSPKIGHSPKRIIQGNNDPSDESRRQSVSMHGDSPLDNSNSESSFPSTTLFPPSPGRPHKSNGMVGSVSMPSFSPYLSPMTNNRKQNWSESRSVGPVERVFSPTGDGSLCRNSSNLANIDEIKEFERPHLPIEIGGTRTPERVDASENEDESRHRCHTDPIGRRRSNTFQELNRMDNSKIENDSVRDERPHYGRQRSQSWNDNVVRHSSNEPSREWFWIWS